MEPQDHLDLSDWQFVEVWTIEETALIWAGVNPIAHIGTRLHDLKGMIAPDQYSKACIFQRAIAEAVCGGTLAFVAAWEDREDYQNSYVREVEFPDLPDQNSIIHYMTRINQAAFIKWAQSKKMWSSKQQRKQALLKQVPQLRNTVIDAENIIEMEGPAKTLALAPPPYLDPTHPLSAAELVAANEAWLAVIQDGDPKNSGTAVRAAIMKFLNNHPTHRSLGSAAKERVCTVANWDKKGGAARTPGAKK